MNIIYPRNNNSRCNRIYPEDNLSTKVSKYCSKNPFPYTFDNNSYYLYKDLSSIISQSVFKDNILFFTVIDDNSFKYLLNLYKTFLFPYNIQSLVTIVFYRITLLKCKKYRIFCIYEEWPFFLKNISKIDTKKRLWFLKYYYMYIIVKHNVSILYIDSDVLFINNCLRDLINRKEDVVLLKSQLPPKQAYGNSGITYNPLKYVIYSKIKSSILTIRMMQDGLDYIKYHIAKGAKGYLGDQEVLTISLRAFKNISKGLYTLPLYTVGLPDENVIKTLCVVHPIHCEKDFSIKERLLYYVDNKGYYSSTNNKYVTFSRNILQNNISVAIELSKKYNLTIILPDQYCVMPDCVYRMNNYFGDLSLIKKFNTLNISVRESISFLFFIFSIINCIIIS